MEHNDKTPKSKQVFSSKFKEYDLQAVSKKKKLTRDAANLPLKQTSSMLLNLPKEIIQAVILYAGILTKSALAQLCKEIYFMVDLKLEHQMYQATLKAMPKQDYNLKVRMENWYNHSLQLRAFAFDDISYLHKYLGQNFKVSPNPFVRQAKRAEPLLWFKYLLASNSIALFDYFTKAFEDLEKDNNVPWKYLNNEEFQSFVWLSVSALADQLVVDSKPVEIIKGSVVDKIMSFASKYSHIVLRIMLSHMVNGVPGNKFPYVKNGVDAFLSNLLLLKETYPFDLTGICPEQMGKVPLSYKSTPLELSCRSCFLDIFRVLVQHTPLLPNIAYIAILGTTNTNSPHTVEFFDELVAHGAGVNVPLPPQQRTASESLALTVDSPLGLACFVYGLRVNRMAWAEWLLTKKAKFSEFEMEQIQNSPELMARTEKIRKIINEGDYVPLSRPWNNWQGPKLHAYTEEGEPEAWVRILDTRTLQACRSLTNIYFTPGRRCQMWAEFGRSIQYNGTWRPNENDNVITFIATSGEEVIAPICFEYRVFRAFNDTALLVTEQHLQQRSDKLVWLYGVLAEDFWLNQEYEQEE